jgi:hypothetical protein
VRAGFQVHGPSSTLRGGGGAAGALLLLLLASHALFVKVPQQAVDPLVVVLVRIAGTATVVVLLLARVRCNRRIGLLGNGDCSGGGFSMVVLAVRRMLLLLLLRGGRHVGRRWRRRGVVATVAAMVFSRHQMIVRSLLRQMVVRRRQFVLSLPLVLSLMRSGTIAAAVQANVVHFQSLHGLPKRMMVGSVIIIATVFFRDDARPLLVTCKGRWRWWRRRFPMHAVVGGVAHLAFVVCGAAVITRTGALYD